MFAVHYQQFMFRLYIQFEKGMKPQPCANTTYNDAATAITTATKLHEEFRKRLVGFRIWVEDDSTTPQPTNARGQPVVVWEKEVIVVDREEDELDV